MKVNRFSKLIVVIAVAMAVAVSSLTVGALDVRADEVVETTAKAPFRPQLALEAYSIDSITFSFGAYAKAKDYVIYIDFGSGYQKMSKIQMDVLRGKNTQADEKSVVMAKGFATNVDASIVDGRVICKVSGLKSCGKKYKFKAVCVTKKKASKMSNAVIRKTGLMAPSNLSATMNEDKSVTIKWDALEKATSYRIFRKASADSKFINIASVKGDKTEYIDNSAQDEADYEYKIRAVGKTLDGKNCLGAYSSPVKITEVTEKDEQSQEDKKEDTTEEKKDDSTGDKKDESTEEKKEESSGIIKREEDNDDTEVVVEIPKDNGKIKLSTTTLFLTLNETANLTYKTELTDPLVWYSNNTNVAVVSSTGQVMPIAAGTCDITATIGLEQTVCTVVVKDAKMLGIDVSKWQDVIKWDQVAASGIDYAMIRMGHSVADVSKGTFAPALDETFDRNYDGAKAAGLAVGAYYYSVAMNVKQVKKEAQATIDALAGRELDLPVAFDLEDSVQKSLPQETKHEMINAFKKEIEDAGYKFMLYCSGSYIVEHLSAERLNTDEIEVWLAQWYSGNLYKQNYKTNYKGNVNVKMWQYTDCGVLDGIWYVDGTGKYCKRVDLDMAYFSLEDMKAQ